MAPAPLAGAMVAVVMTPAPLAAAVVAVVMAPAPLAGAMVAVVMTPAPLTGPMVGAGMRGRSRRYCGQDRRRQNEIAQHMLQSAASAENRRRC
jgi:hypothetical protein